MAWTSPRTWVAGEQVTASLMNTYVRDEFSYLKDSPTFDGSVIVTTALAVTGTTTLTGALTANGDVNLGNAAADTLTVTATVVGAPFKTYSETQTAPTISGSALTLNCALGTYFAVSLNAACTVTISNPPASGRAIGIVVVFTADGTIRTITWPGSVVWPGGSAPTMTGTLNKRDMISLITYDGGTVWFGLPVAQNM